MTTTLLALLAAPSAYAGAVGLHLTMAHQRYRLATGEPGPPPEVHLAELRRRWLLRSWRFTPRAEPPTHVADPRPVLLVHGFVGRPTQFRGLQAALHRAGRPTHAVDLGWKLTGVANYAPALIAALEAHPEVDVVAHSMGGVVLRHTLHVAPALRDRVRSAITLGTPHRGTAAADLPVPIPGDIGDLQPESRFLQELPDLAELLPGRNLVAVGARWDVVVLPIARALPPGMRHVVLDDLGHNGLLTEPRAHDAVLAALSAA